MKDTNINNLPAVVLERHLKRCIAVFTLPILLAFSFIDIRGASAQAPQTALYFTQSGHTVGGAFLRFFDANGGVRIFGLPITDEMGENGRTVQYFERQRFEYHPEFAGTTFEVQLSLLGRDVSVGRLSLAPIAPFTSTSKRMYIPATGHSLGGSFLSFWQANGDVRVFGYPISEPVAEGGLTVQYFERARMEYHPEKASTGYGVELGLLGKDLLQVHTASQPQLQTAPAPTNPPSYAYEQELYSRINGARKAAGLQLLALDPAISSLAEHRSVDMIQKGYFSHDAPAGDTFINLLKGAGIHFQLAGEIIAYNNYADTVYRAFDDFMHSPTHYAIIMDGRYNSAGVGEAVDSKGYHYYTVIFVQK